MAATSGQVTVSTTAVALNAAETDVVGGTVLYVKNTDATNGAALGGSAVAAGTGFRLPAGVTLGPIELAPGEQLYAIRTGAADVTVDVLRLGS
jgi:hypothetical protein